MSTPAAFRLLALREPRAWLAYKLSDLGGALARLGNRLDRDAAGDYSHGYSDGLKMAGVWVASTEPMKRERAIRLLERLGVDVTPDFLGQLGWGEAVEQSKQQARDAFDERQH